MDQAGARFTEGPVELAGADLVAVQVRERTGVVLGSGALEMKAGVIPGVVRALSPVARLSTARRLIRRLGPEGAAAGLRGLRYLDAEVVTAAAGCVLDATVYGLDDPRLGLCAADDPRLFADRYRLLQITAQVGATTMNSIGVGAGANSGTLANADDADGAWVRSTTAATAGTFAHFAHTANLRRNWGCDETVVIKTPVTITSLRLWVSTSNSTALLDTQAANTGAYFRYSTDAGDVGWAVATANTAAQTLTTNVYPFAADTVYRMRTVQAADHVRFYINGEHVHTETLTLPVAATNMTGQALVEARAASARDIRWSRFTALQAA